MKIDTARRCAAFGAMALTAIACSEGGGSGDAVARGEQVYRNVCVTCHGADPSLDGVLGPSVAGASRELLEAKVLHGTYPEGYAPRRGSGQMPKLTYLEDAIPDLAAYLGTFPSDAPDPP